MGVRMRKSLSLVVFMGVMLGQVVWAAEITTVMSAADEGDPIDLAVYPAWNFSLRTATISREDGTPGQYSDILTSRRTTHSLDVNIRIGLYHDLELFTVLPVVLFDQTKLRSVSNPGASYSPLVTAPYDGRKRSGFGDMTLGIRYAPFQQWRDPFYPSWVVSVAWTLPTGRLMKATNGQVGRGVHWITFETAISRRISFLEPYFDIFGTLNVPGGTTLFREYRDTQKRVWPGAHVGLAFGGEFVPWEVKRADGKRKQYATVDIGFRATFVFQGREYTDLFEVFGNSACSQNDGSADCITDALGGQKTLSQYDWTLRNAGDDPYPKYMDGITDVAPYAVYSTWIGFNVQPIEYFSLGFKFMYSRETSHVLTQASVGDDLDGGGVQYTNGFGKNEYNPVYNSSVDNPGNRFKSEGANVFGVMLMLQGRY